MSNSPEYVEPKAAGKVASFSQTCSLLRQYLKEKGSFGDLSLGMTCNVEGNGNGTSEKLHQTATTMNLFPMTEKSADVSNRNTRTPSSYRSMDLFPQQAGFTSSAPREDAQRKLDSSVTKSGTQEPQTAQMTIFYAGQVIVFNDFPADKAKEVMLLASKGSSQNHPPYPAIPVNSHAAFAPNIAKTPAETSSSIPSTPISIPNFGSNLRQERIQPAAQPIASDLPIARRASLHRFLEKRKDRIIAKAPYQTSGPMAAGPTKPAEGKPWLGLAAQSLK